MLQRQKSPQFRPVSRRHIRINTSWYKKYIHVKGIPIIASKKVNSRALSKTDAVTNNILIGKSYGKKTTMYLKQYQTKIGIWDIASDVTYGWSQGNAEKGGVFQDFSKIHTLGFNTSAGYQLNSHNAFGIQLNSPLKGEKGSLVIKSPYDAEKINLAPMGRELNLILHNTHQFRNAATLTTSLQYTHDNGHTRDQDSSRIMAEYSVNF